MAAEIAAKVTRILSTDNTVNYIHSYNPPPGVCKLHYEDGTHSYDKSCLDRIHHNYLFDYLLGKNSQPQIGANVPINSSSDYLVHYLIEVLLITFMVPLIKMAYTRKQTRIPKGFNPFRDRPFAPIPGYRCYYTIMEDESVMTSDTISQEFVHEKNSDVHYDQDEDPLAVATCETEPQRLDLHMLFDQLIELLGEDSEDTTFIMPRNVSSIVFHQLRMLRGLIAMKPDVTKVRGEPMAIAMSTTPRICYDVATSLHLLLPAPRARKSTVSSSTYEGVICTVKEIFDSESMLERETHLTRKNIPRKIGYYCRKKIPGGVKLCLHTVSTNLKIYLEKDIISLDRAQEGAPEIEERSICEQIAQGVYELHDRNTAHGDLTPENVLIERRSANSPRIWLADFSLSSDDEYSIDLVDYKNRLDPHRLEWYAPEVFERTSVELNDYLRADIYMLGSLFSYVLYESRTGKVAEFIQHANEVESSILQGRIRKVSRPQYSTLRFKSLIMAMTARNPIERPSILCVAMHPAFWCPKKSYEFLEAVNKWLMKSLVKPQQTIISQRNRRRNSNYTPRRRNLPVEHIEKDRQEPSPCFERAVSSAMVESLKPFAPQICRGKNWYTHLENWLQEYLKKVSSTKNIDYDYAQPAHLIRLIRNLRNHYMEIDERYNFKIENENHLAEYFAQFFPHLLPIVYERMQKFKPFFPEFYYMKEDIKYVERSITPEALGPDTQIGPARPSD